MINFSSIVGPRNVELARLWVGPAGRFLASGIVIGLFVTEWKAVVDKIPYYNSKYQKTE